MNRSTLLPTHKVPIDNFNALASQLRQAGAKFRSSIHKQDATIVFSQLPSKALSILESGANFQETCEPDLSGSTLTQVSNIAQGTSEFASNMEFPERQEVSQHEAEQVLAETQLTEVGNTTESGESALELVESIEKTSMDIPNLATERQLLELSKTKLKKLANKYGIEGRTKLEHHELAAALANKVPLDNL